MSNVFWCEGSFNNLLHHIREGFAQINNHLQRIEDKMANTFADVTTLITAVANDNTAANNAVSAQIVEVKQLLIDYAAAVAAGQPIPQANIDSAIQMLQATDDIIKANTKAVQDSAAAIQSADPNTNPTQPPTPATNPPTTPPVAPVPAPPAEPAPTV